MNTEIVNNIQNTQGPFRLLFVGGNLSDDDIKLLIKRGMKEIYIYGEDSGKTEMNVDHIIVSENIEKNISLDITTVSFDTSSENIEDALLLFSNNHSEIENNYILYKI